MLRHFALPLVLSAALSVQAQTAPKPAEPVESSGVTLRSGTHLVVVDVVVTDKNHKPIQNLKKSDFILTEDKKPQTLRSFEEHSGLNAADAVKSDAFPKMPPGIFTNYQPTPVNSALNILLLDTLNTPMKDQAYVRGQLLDYLKKAKPGTSVAIFGLSTRLVMLQGFTSDPEVLKSAITQKRPDASVLLNDPVSGSLQETLSDQMAEGGMTSTDVIANVATFESMQQSFQLQMRAQYTLDGFNALARYLTGIPGRKNLIWFSGSFPLDILPDADLAAAGGDPFAGVANSEEEFRETTNLLTRSQVAVYPVDARGLMTSPTMDASQSGRQFARNPGAMLNADTKFFTQTAAEHMTMQQMADDTGGEAFYNTNGLSQAVSKAIENGSNYYTLTYTPSNSKWNGDYRHIQVALEERGYILSYRRGYYADDPDAAPKKHGNTETAATAVPALSSIQKALMHGAPGSTQILFKARVLPALPETEALVAAGNQPNPDPKKFPAPYRRYAIDYASDPRMVRFEISPDGNYHCHLEYTVFAYDPNGELVNIMSASATSNLTPARFAALRNGGIPFHEEISVPAKGQYSLRLAIHDLKDDYIGAVEVPVAAVKNLAPLTPPPAPASPPAPTAH